VIDDTKLPVSDISKAYLTLADLLMLTTTSSNLYHVISLMSYSVTRVALCAYDTPQTWTFRLNLGNLFVGNASLKNFIINKRL